MQNASAKSFFIAGLVVLGLGVVAWFLGEGNLSAIVLVPVALILVAAGLVTLAIAFLRKYRSVYGKLIILLLVIVLFLVIFMNQDYFNRILTSF